MPTQRFPLEPGGPERLSLIHNRMGTKSTIAIDGKPLLADLTRKQLGEGVAVTLPDGSSLTVKMIAAGFLKGDQNGLDIRRNGIPIPGSVGTPEHAVRTAKTTGIFLYVLAGLNAAAGVVIQLAGNDPFLATNNAGWPYLLGALVLATLGLFVHRKMSVVAIGIAMAYLLVDGIASVLLQAEAGQRPSTGGLVMRVFFVIFLFGAFQVIRRHKAQRAA